MPKIDIIINPNNNQPVEFTGKVFYGWKCPRTGLVFRFKSAYIKHLKQLARSEINRKKLDRGEIDGNSILYEGARSASPDKHQKHAFNRAKDFLNIAYGFNNWSEESLTVLSDYILTVSIKRERKKLNPR